MKRFWRDLLIVAGIALVIYLGVNLVSERVIVDGSSMVPSLENNQRLVILKEAYLFSPPQRGDVIIIHPPIAPEKMWVKRLIGLPGDTVEIKGGKVYVNGVALSEPYIEAPPQYTFRTHTVPAGHYFVLGDNRNDSTDSHFGWTVTRDNIIGKAWLVYWPVDEWGLVRNFDLSGQLPNTNTAAK